MASLILLVKKETVFLIYQFLHNSSFLKNALVSEYHVTNIGLKKTLLLWFNEN